MWVLLGFLRAILHFLEKYDIITTEVVALNLRGKGIFKTIIIISILADVLVAFLINKFSASDFDLSAPHNIWMIIILVVLVLVLIVCKIIEHNYSVKTRSRKFQKVFRENGGFETIVDEMKDCLRKHDYKSFNKLKRIAEDFEK